MNSNTQHTPGPWKYLHGKNTMLVSADESTIVCSAIRQPRETAPDVYNANARLIAAAPDLLAALLKLADLAQYVPFDSSLETALVAARAALAKAGAA